MAQTTGQFFSQHYSTTAIVLPTIDWVSFPLYVWTQPLSLANDCSADIPNVQKYKSVTELMWTVGKICWPTIFQNIAHLYKGGILDRGIAQVVGSDSLQFQESLPTTEDISYSSEENNRT